MTFWSEVNQKITNVIEVVQKNPILDALASSALQNIPVVGGLLIGIYQNSKDSPEENTAQILQLLKNMESMNEEKLEEFCKNLDKNKELILKNQKFLKAISQDTSDILHKLEIASQEHEEISNKINDIFSEIKKLNQTSGHITLENVTTFSGSGFKISWPNTWEKVSEEEMLKIHMDTKEFMEKLGLSYNPNVLKLNLRRIPEKLGIDPVITISQESVQGKNAAELLNDFINQLAKAGWKVIDYHVDDVFQSYTVEMKNDPSILSSKFPSGIQVYQIQKGFVKNGNHTIIALTNLSEEIMETAPTVKKEIIDIMQGFSLT